MNIVWVGEGMLSEKARNLVDFDVASIRQTVSGAHAHEPAIWLVAMAQYEKAGRVLRDSPNPRLIAYAPDDRVLYATDGCNCCARAVDLDVAALDGEAFAKFSVETGIPHPLLERLAAMARK